MYNNILGYIISAIELKWRIIEWKGKAGRTEMVGLASGKLLANYFRRNVYTAVRGIIYAVSTLVIYWKGNMAEVTCTTSHRICMLA